jgi:DNA-binding LacI/PurR family transcriptional regulator
MPQKKKDASQTTIDDVAREAGVSIATVSRVLNGTARVDPAKEARVREAVLALGFSPRAAARALAGRKTHVLGLVVPEISGDFFVPMLRGIEGAAREAGYELLVQTGRPHDGDRALSCLVGQSADGLLLFVDSADGEALRRVSAARLPAVLLYTEAQGLDIPSVTIENEAGAALAVCHLIDRHGRRRIACVRGPLGVHDAEARLSGYRSALATCGIPFDPGLVVPGDFQAEVAAASVRGLLARGVDFDAVFAGDDASAMGVLAALAEAGLAPGRDLSVIGFDDLPFAANAIPPLATVRAPTEEVGAAAVRILIRRIEEGTAAGSPESLVLPTAFVPRASCGCGTEGPGEGRTGGQPGGAGRLPGRHERRKG